MSLICPNCESKSVRRSQRKGAFETFVLKLTPVRPFRCRDCNHRFYRLNLEFQTQSKPRYPPRIDPSAMAALELNA